MNGTKDSKTFEDYADRENGAYTYTHARTSKNNLTIAINRFDSSNPTADFTIVINSIRFHD